MLLMTRRKSTTPSYISTYIGIVTPTFLLYLNDYLYLLAYFFCNCNNFLKRILDFVSRHVRTSLPSWPKRPWRVWTGPRIGGTVTHAPAPRPKWTDPSNMTHSSTKFEKQMRLHGQHMFPGLDRGPGWQRPKCLLPLAINISRLTLKLLAPPDACTGHAARCLA
jgi:hypothetical protein